MGARPFHAESLQIKRQRGDPFGIYIALLNFGEMNLALKDYHTAGVMWRECLTIVIEHHIKTSIPWVFKALGGLFAVTDTPLNAAR